MVSEVTEVDEHNRFMLDDILVSPQHNNLSLQDQSVTVQPKVMAVLCYLAEHRDRVVGSDELLDQVWKGRVVTHASVQKSINALRNALTELAGEREYVAHFSKRGYQLLLPVVRLGSEELEEVAVTRESAPSIPSRFPRRSFVIGFITLLFLGTLALLWLWLRSATPDLVVSAEVEKHHTTHYTATTGLTSETGHERGAEPHPDGRRIAYIRDAIVRDPAMADAEDDPGRAQSQIMIRDDRSRDWLLASVDGSWADLAWSPSGRNLVATEIRRAEGLPWMPAYYERPNYLYTFHIFTLDFRGERLLEKNLLSQWQGIVESVTWWDENTIEFIASLGPNSANERYRYVIADQKLSSHPLEDEGFVPVKSAVHDKVSALISRRRGRAQVTFLDAREQLIASWQLATSRVDISWIPDGSGLLVFETDSKKLYNLYTTGEIQPIRFPFNADLSISRPRYSSNGGAIVMTAAAARSAFYLLAPDGADHKISGDYVNEQPIFSADGENILFLSLRNAQYQLWRWRSGEEQLLTRFAKRPSKIVWPAGQDFLIYREGNAIWQYQFGGRAPTLLLAKAEQIEPLGYDPLSQWLWSIKQINETRNIWRQSLTTGEEKQLTFGSVGSALEHHGKIYFQYTHQRGLWLWDEAEQNPVQISVNLPENSKLLRITRDAVFFVAGGSCRESDPQMLDINTDAIAVVFERSQSKVTTHDYHPAKGILQTRCILPESNIIELTAEK